MKRLSPDVAHRTSTAAWLTAIGIGLAFAATVSAQDAPNASAQRSIEGVNVLEVRSGLYMLTADGANLAVQTGPEGTVVVDTGGSSSCAKVVAAVQRIAVAPIRYLINTSADADRIGCNARLAKTGFAFSEGPLGWAAPIIATQNTLLELLARPQQQYPAEALPSELFTGPERHYYMNGQGVRVIWMPAAHTNGDAVVLFRGSDVIAAGNILDVTHFPIIDLPLHGSINGEIAALNRLLDELTIEVSPRWLDPGGTMIIPGRGQLCNAVDLLAYRDMVTIVRDRVRSLIAQGRSLRQIEGDDATRGYDTRYGGDDGQAGRQFVDAVYATLIGEAHAKTNP